MLGSHGLCSFDDILHGSGQLLGSNALLGEQCHCVFVCRVQLRVIEALSDVSQLGQVFLSGSNQVSKEGLGSGNHGDVVATIQGSLCLGGLLCQSEGLNIVNHCA